MKLQEQIKASGYVRIYSKSGPEARPVLVHSGRNLLVNNFYLNIPKLLAGQVGNMIGNNSRTVQDGSANWVTYMSVGTGTTAPALIDQSLQTPVLNSGSPIVMPISTVSFSTPFTGSVTFNAVLPGGSDSSPYNGVNLSEVGLFAETGTMYARYVYTPIIKTSVFQLNYEWTITFAP